MPWEDNYETDILAKLATSEIVEMLVDVLMKVAEAPFMEKVMVSAVEERED